jgi:hypothetical protein
MNSQTTARTANSQWQPIETAPVGVFLVWIPSIQLTPNGSAWPAWKQENGQIFSNAHGVLNEIDTGYRNRELIATHWTAMEPPK